jgi:hypothetical protein
MQLTSSPSAYTAPVAANELPIGVAKRIGRFTLTNTTQNFVAGAAPSLVFASTAGVVLYVNNAGTTTNFNTTANRVLGTVCSAPIPVPCVPSVLAAQTTPQSCANLNDGAIDLSITGGDAPTAYAWSSTVAGFAGATTQDISGLAPGDYSVVVTSTPGCTATATYTVAPGATPVEYFADVDLDTYGGASLGLFCAQPNGSVAIGGDCNDASAAINPGATEVCDANDIDEDCDGLADDADPSATGKTAWYPDTDLDTYGSSSATATQACNAPSGSVSSSTDCNDNDASVNPGIAQDLCNGVDNDCDGATDEDATFSNYYVDADGDGFGAGLATSSCSAIAGSVLVTGDCAPTNPAIFPGATEVCNGIDDDCDLTIDNGLSFISYFTDSDGDGYGTGTVQSLCANPGAGFATQTGDCDDARALTNPGASETCNNIDDDCDGDTDDGLSFVQYFADVDGDTYGGASLGSFCAAPSGAVTVAGDCNDNSAAVNPGAVEVCNGIDDDCVGGIDNGLSFISYYTDSDGDGYGTGTAQSLCANPGAGFATQTGDCDDARALTNPGAAETCNNIDDDCDGATDDGLSFVTYYADVDGDTYGAPGGQSLCANPGAGFVTTNGDCNDNNSAVNPGATESCNSIDDDCDGLTDEDVAYSNYYLDADGDTYGLLSDVVSACAPVTGRVLNSTDCNDGNAAINPGATEVCDLIDNDCDGSTDEGVQLSFYADGDADGFGAGAATLACTAPSGFVSSNTDCNDASSAVNPSATEVCNGIDDDCDTFVDDADASLSGAPSWYADADGDNYGTGTAVVACIAPPAHVSAAGDCDDTNSAINPGASESCNSIDDNCNGLTDEGITPQYTYYADADGDTYGNAAAPVSSCYSSAPSGTVTNALDCADNDAAINPAATEVCGDLVDNNCDGAVDEGCTCTNPSTALAGVDFAVCAGQNANLIGAIGGSASSAVWTTSGSGSFGNATNPTTTYTPSAADRTAGSVVLTLTSNDPDGVGPCVAGVSSITLTINPLPAPAGAISGPASLCYPQTPVTYSVAPTAGATSYSWTVPAGTTILSGQGTNAITVSWPFSVMHNGLSGDICVTPQNSNSCGSSVSSCLPISVQVSVPVAAGSISGAGRACPNDAAIYSVAPVSRAGYYIWTLPAGATIVGASNTNVINVSFGPSFAGGTISVQAANACGTGAVRSRTIGVNVLTAPASISGLLNGVCSASGVVYTAAPVTGAISYLWSVPAGATIVGPSTGSSIAVDFTGSFSTGSVTCRAVNNCGSGSTRSVTVKGSPATPNAITGPLTVCPSSSYTYSVGTIAGTSSYVWTVPTGATITAGLGTKDITVQFGSFLSSSLAVSVRATNACGASSTRTLSGIAVVACPRIGENNAAMALNAFPNPANEVLNITFSSDVVANANLRLVDLTGRVVYNEAKEVVEGFNATSVVVKGLASGIYTLQLQMNDRTEQLRIFVD